MKGLMINTGFGVGFQMYMFASMVALIVLRHLDAKRMI